MTKWIMGLALVAVLLAGGCASDVAGFGEIARQDTIARTNEAQASAEQAKALAEAQVRAAEIRADAQIRQSEIRADVDQSRATQDYALATQAQALYREAGDRWLIVFLVVALVTLVSVVLFYIMTRERGLILQSPFPPPGGPLREYRRPLFRRMPVYLVEDEQPSRRGRSRQDDDQVIETVFGYLPEEHRS